MPQLVGWVERERNPSIAIREDGGFREGLNPPYGSPWGDGNAIAARLRMRSDLPDRRSSQILVKRRRQKDFCFPETRIMRMVRPSRLDARGASRSSRHARRDAMDAKMPTDERHRRGRQSCVVLAPRRRCQVGDDAFRVAPMTVTKKLGLTGKITE